MISLLKQYLDVKIIYKHSKVVLGYQELEFSVVLNNLRMPNPHFYNKHVSSQSRLTIVSREARPYTMNECVIYR